MIVNFNYEKLDRIRVNYKTAFGICVGIYDAQGRIITRRKSLVRSSVCNFLRTQSDQFDQACSECDRDACRKCHETREPFFYRCHVGLYEYITPIFCQNILVGFMIAGQIIPSDNYEMVSKEVVEKVRGFGIIDDELTIALVENQKEDSLRHFKAVCELLQDSAASLWLYKGISVHEDNVVCKIDEFIRDNLQDELTVESICQTFQISKTRLTKLSMDHFGTSMGKYIWKVRIEESEQLLKNTRLQICEVARRVGIPDYNYFSKVFKSGVGLSPKEYRKKFEKLGSVGNNMIEHIPDRNKTNSYD